MVTVEITTVANGGYGIGRHQGKVVFVPFSYPGDVIELNILSEKKKHLWGSIHRVISASEHRIPPKCPYMGLCGGCMWGMANYLSQISWKRFLIEQAFYKFLNFKGDIEIVTDETYIFNYRTRVKLHSDGNVIGFYKFHSYEVVEVSKCVLIHKNIIEVVKNIKNVSKNTEITITVNPFGTEMLIYTNKKVQDIGKIYKDIYNYNNDQSPRRYFLFGKLPIVNGSFSQNSLILNKLLINTVKKFLEPADKKILDLYCGSGNLTINLPCSEFEVVGVDIDSSAINLAKMYSNFDYRAGDESLMRRLILSGEWDVVILDPPREGAKSLVGDLKFANTKKIIYVSCNYITQCRDLKPLLENGWKIENVSMIDLFPHTPHVETVVLLKR